ncbi:tRNA(Met) cytidine acetyltransferase TmcA [Stygiolobus caldivivus]|uniref:tRNA(Met) cytidine acetyltransferase TmcA n=1 Tax=Stygiolobus caldivivus TaxID=2824673 RepID=A0A8D5ZH55_9CREN|nr:tRNA(Met) cytidine acetyltransferase TmcA [Stygiolobus caldivivus]BCU69389.1 ATPase [Stygiolobus caldivivus]
MEREQFFQLLREGIEDGRERYYRNLVYIEDANNYVSLAKEVLTLYLTLNPEAQVAYAFHPWVKGSKDRMKELRTICKNFIDIDYSSSERYLGATFDVVILDLVDNFEPNYVGRLVDLARGGGLIILYTNSLAEGKVFRSSLIKAGKIRDIYERRFIRKLNEHEGIFTIINSVYNAKPFKGKLGERPRPVVPNNPIMPEPLHNLCMSPDQNRVLDSFINLRGANRRVLVITASRGRGKSAITGLGLAGYLYKLSTRERGKKLKIVITAPSISSTSQTMEFLKRGLEVLGIRHKEKRSNLGFINSIEGDFFKVFFEAPEAVLETEGDMLVIDEAAAVGIGIIDSALKIWRKVVLVTTVHGYEGSGKAFLRYLNRVLKLRKASVYWQEMRRPLRYSEGDPIERWLYDTLLLDAEPEEPDKEKLSVLEFETLNQDELFQEDTKLRQVYSILVTAHYRNNPNDLMIMADGVHHKLFSLSTVDGAPIGVVQVAEEGGLPEDMIDSALKGVTFDGDLIPDRLIKHSRLKEFGRMKGWRVVRIAIMQELQDKGFGSEILKMVIESGKSQGLDWIGSAFMGDVRVINFWVKNGFRIVHVSPKRNEKLGDFPVVVIYPLSEIAKEAVEVASYILKDKVLNTIHDVYFSMDPEVARIIIYGTRAHKEIKINKIYLDKAVAFVQGVSPYESSADGIHMLTLKYFWDSKRDWSLTPEEETLLIAKVLQGRPWRFTSASLRSNRTQVNEMLYEIVAQLLIKYYGITADVKTGVELKDIISDDIHNTEQ